MILIADGGSTKTDWVLYDRENDSISAKVKTQGFNPTLQKSDDIYTILHSEIADKIDNSLIETIFYYGAGCAYPEANKRMFDALKKVFNTNNIEINSDLLAAARALCGHNEGIACILGTGSNSCLFDGEKIVDNTPSLGYILGDEGSGAALGKRLVSDCLKKQLSPALTKKFLEKYNLTTANILEQVYHKPMPNRYLAQFAPFLADNRKEAEVQTLLKYCFTLFFQRNTMVYRRSWLPIHIVGSIGVAFANELKETAESLGLSIGNIVDSPMNGLIEYHK
ncbi:MAG: ATPase [Bacteroidaceae bacterium]|nr:ATPase [Bacteroidaceae bacterium]